jgi:hypothetical protein
LLIDRDKFLDIINNSTELILVNSSLTAFRALLPRKEQSRIFSLAIAPLILDGEIIESLNHGDISESRYEPEMDTSIFKQLATIVSICLSSVMAHEKLNILDSKDSLTKLISRRVIE